jgi:hypothetical protein
MPTGVVSNLKLNLSQNSTIQAFTPEGAASARQKRRRDHARDTQLFEKSLITSGALTLVGLLGLWKWGQMTPEQGLFRSINAQSIPILSHLRLPKTGFSKVDLTSTAMTTIQSVALTFSALLTRQHAFETFGGEMLKRIFGVSVIKSVKGSKNKSGQYPVFSVNRWFLDYMMKPRNLTRKIDTLLSKSAWVRFNSSWRNTVGLPIQDMFGLNTPFEAMFPQINEIPKKSGTLKDVRINAFRERLTLQQTEWKILDALEKGIVFKAAYTQAQKAFKKALNSRDVETLRRSYEQFAQAQVDYNRHFYDIRYKQPLEGNLTDHWVGHDSRNTFVNTLQEWTGQSLDPNTLTPRTQDLWTRLDAINEQANRLTPQPLNIDEIKWEKELILLGQKEAEKSLQELRDALKCGYLTDLLKAQFEKVLLLEDDTPGVPKNTPERIKEIFIPYLEEVTKYYTYDDEHLAHVQALQKKYPNLPSPVNLDELKYLGKERLVDYLISDLDSLNPQPKPIRPSEAALEHGYGIEVNKPLSAEEKLIPYKKLVHKRLNTFVTDLKEKQNLVLNLFTYKATHVYNDLIKQSIQEYTQAQAHSSQELKLGHYLAKAFGQARYLNTQAPANNATATPRLFAGQAFDILDAGFKLNERINDIDQYKRNYFIKTMLQVAFQTAVTAFVLSNLLFFIVYNTFSRLDPDYKGQGKIPLNNWVKSFKGFLGQKEALEAEKAPVEAHVNVSLNLNETLLKQGHSSSRKRPQKPIAHPPQGGLQS